MKQWNEIKTAKNENWIYKKIRSHSAGDLAMKSGWFLGFIWGLFLRFGVYFDERKENRKMQKAAVYAGFRTLTNVYERWKTPLKIPR